MAGHGGIKKTYERIKEKFYWPNMVANVKKHCKECQISSTKKDSKGVRAPLNSVEVDFPFEKCFMDLIGPMPESGGYKYIIVFVCALTNWAELRPLRSTDAQEAAKAFFEEVICRYGCCTQLITDRGTNFTSMLFTEVCKLIQVDKYHVTAFHPEGNGVCERLNGSIMKILTTILQDKQNSWSDSLSAALFA